MSYDIKLDTEIGKFKYRVSGALIVKDKLLTVQIMNNGFYCLPGGHALLGEFSNESLIREFEEEVKTPVVIKSPLALIESIFERKDGSKVHELGITYILENSEELKIPFEDYTIFEKDGEINKQLDFKWIKLEEIDKYDFRPSILKEQLKSKDFNFKHYKTN